jgi:hypothetical protein
MISFDSSANHQQAPIQSTIKSAPSFTGSADNTISGFDGNFTHNALAMKSYVTGSCTAQCPGSGYTVNPVLAQIYGLMVASNTGYQGFDVSGNPTTARTNIDMSRLKGVLTGNSNGDLSVYTCSGTQSANNPTPAPAPTSWHGFPAITCFTSITTATVDNSRTYGMDFSIGDGGHDISADVMTVDPNRTNNTGGDENAWEGIRIEEGPNQTKQIDTSFFSSTQDTIGIDLSARNAASPSPGPAIALQANDYLGLNCANSPPAGAGHFSRYTTCPDTGVKYVSANSAVETHIAGTTSLQVSASAVTVPSGINFNMAGVAASSNVCTDSSHNASPCPSTSPTLPPEVIGSLGSGATVTAPNATWSPVPCGSNSIGCSSSTVSVTLPSYSTGSGKYRIRVDYSTNTTGAATTQFLTSCVTSTSTMTNLGSTQGNGGGANPYCSGAPATAVLGMPAWGDSAASLGSLNSYGVGLYSVAGGATYNFTPYVKESSSGATAVYATLLVFAVPCPTC